MRLKPALSVISLACALVAAFLWNARSGNSNGSPPVVRLQGAGASFPAPLYNKWFKDYSASHDGVQVDYQSVGSGSGIKSVIDGTVDFGASDAAMSPEEIAQVDRGVLLLPMTAGSIVIAYNLDGVSDLKLSREAYVAIFSGKVNRWDDPLIARCNPGVRQLPPHKPLWTRRSCLRILLPGIPIRKARMLIPSSPLHG
jgi:ABC-type phosphate transport system substrate-binding protein